MFRAIFESIGVIETPDETVTNVPTIVRLPEEVRQTVGSRGVQQNLRLVIRGDRGTGKTALLHRLQGKPVPPGTYCPSTSISAAPVRWQPSKNVSECSVSVEAWDVVDEGVATAIPSSTTGRIRVESLPDVPKFATDATTVDVYRGADCAIFMVDVRRRETLAYVETKVKAVPRHIPVLLCANFCDSEQRTVDREALEELLANIPQAVSPFVASLSPPGQSALDVPPALVELSCTSGSGLRALYSYIDIPFRFARLQARERKVFNDYSALGETFGRFMDAKKAPPAAHAESQNAEVVCEYTTGEAADDRHGCAVDGHSSVPAPPKMARSPQLIVDPASGAAADDLNSFLADVGDCEMFEDGSGSDNDIAIEATTKSKRSPAVPKPSCKTAVGLSDEAQSIVDSAARELSELKHEAENHADVEEAAV